VLGGEISEETKKIGVLAGTMSSLESISKGFSLLSPILKFR